MKQKNRHHVHLLCDISELAALLTASEDIDFFLQRSVEMIACHMDADVCKNIIG
jgi:phosphotransferase system enzyme I (PtsP)